MKISLFLSIILITILFSSSYAQETTISTSQFTNCLIGCCTFFSCLVEKFNSNEERLVIYLDGPVFFIYDDDISTYTTLKINENFTRVIIPLSCKTTKVCETTVLILLKTDKFSFDIKGNLFLKNLYIRANDLHLSSYLSNCYKTEEGCCNETNYEDKTSQCLIKNKVIVRNAGISRLNFYPVFIMNQNIDPLTSNLTLENCEINYLYAIRSTGFYTLIAIDIFPANIIFQNTTIKNFYLMEGFITSTYNRKKKQGKPAAFFLTLINSTIENYNNYDIYELVITFYGSGSVATMAFLYGDNISFIDSRIKLMKYKTFYFESSAIFFRNTSIFDISMRLSYQNFMEFSYSNAVFSQSIFKNFNSSAYLIYLSVSNNLKMFSCEFSSIILGRTSFIYIQQKNEFYLNYTTFHYINLINNSNIISVNYMNTIYFTGNIYDNIMNQIAYFEENNTIFSNKEIFTNLCSIERTIIEFRTTNNVVFKGLLMRNLTMDLQSSAINATFSNNIIFENISIYELTSANQTAFLNLFSYNNLFINASSFNTITSLSTSVLNFMNSNNITIVNTDFSQYKSEHDGGLMSGYQDNIVFFNKCKIWQGSSTKAGGFLSLYTSNSLTIRNSLFTNIIAYSTGGVFSILNKNNLTFSRSVFKNCASTKNNNGGVFYLFNTNLMNLTKCYFINNNAAYGGIYALAQGNKLSINDSEFTLNQAQQGGCFVVYGYNQLFISNSVFFNSSSTDIGGVIAANTQNYINVQMSYFLKSFSQIGGTIYIGSSNNLIIQNSILNMSYSTERGGSLYLNDQNYFYIYNTILQNSESFEESGCIYGYVVNKFYIYQVQFINIFARLRGGAIFLYFNSNLTMNNATFTNSFADLRGGCFYISNKNRIIASNIIIDHDYQNIEFQNTIFFLNNNFFQLKELIFLRDKMGIFISHFNIGNISDVLIYKHNKTISKIYNFYTGSSNDTQDFTVDFFKEDQLFLQVFSSKVNVSNVMYFNITYPLIYALQSEIRLEFLQVKNNNISLEDGSFLFAFQESSILLTNIKISSNQANLFFANTTNLTIIGFSIIYLAEKFIIFSFFQGDAIFKQGVIKYAPPLSQTNNFLNSNEIISKLIFEHGSLSFSLISLINNYGNEGSSLKLINSNVTINKCSFYLNKALFDGGVISYKLEYFYYLKEKITSFFFKLNKSVFIKNAAGNKGGAINFNNNLGTSLSIFINNAIFNKNTGNAGGGFYFNGFSQLSLNRINFFNNIALVNLKNQIFSKEGKGGAIFFARVSNESDLLITFIDLKFINNSADIGGAIFIENKEFFIETINDTEKNNAIYNNKYFSNNKAKLYGNNFASLPKSISFSSIYEKFLYEAYFNDLQSGTAYDCLYSIASYDQFDQLIISKENDIKFDLISSLKLTPNNISIKPSSNDLLLTKNNAGCYCSSGTILPIPYYSKEFLYIISFFSSKSLKLSLSFRNCDIGEFIENNLCIPCPDNTYSLDAPKTLENDKKDAISHCKPCLSTDPFYCYGGSKLTPKPSFWRLNYYSDNFLHCPNPNSCLGYNFTNVSLYNPIMASGECAVGYKGILCAECQDGYGITDKFFCSKCDNEYIYAYLIFSMIFKVVIILFSVHKALIMCLSLITSNIVNLRKVISSILMKILFNHLQCLIIVFSIPSLIMPEVIKQILHFSKTSSPNVTEIISLECALKNMKLSITQHILKLLIVWISPAIIVMISSGYLFFYLKNKKKKYVISNLYDRLRIWFAICMTVLMILYPDCMRICFETFNCINVGYKTYTHYYLASDYSIKCWQGSHLNLIYGAATPFLIVFGVGFPVFVLIKLISHWKTNSLNNKSELLKYGYFYFGYDKQFFFWDMVILARKIAILLIDVFFLTSFDNEAITQPILAIFLVLFVSLYIQLIFQPYRRDKLDLINSLENKSLIALVGTVYVGLLNIEVVFGEKSTSSIILFILVFLINLNFGIFWFLAFFKYIISDKLRKWKLALMSCFISSYAFIKRHFQKITSNRPGVRKDHWAMLDKYTIELKKKTRKARQNPLQESLIEQIRKSSLKNLKKRKSTICIKQPERFKCSNCEMTLKIEEENKKLRDELFSMREKLDNKDAYLKELQTKLSLMKTMIRTNKDMKNIDFDLKNLRTLKSEQSEGERPNVLQSQKSDSELLSDKLKDHFNLVKCLHQKGKLLSKDNYEISTSIFLYTSKDIKKEFYLNFVLFYDLEVEISDMLINYDYDPDKISYIIFFCFKKI